MTDLLAVPRVDLLKLNARDDKNCDDLAWQPKHSADGLVVTCSPCKDASLPWRFKAVWKIKYPAAFVWERMTKPSHRMEWDHNLCAFEQEALSTAGHFICRFATKGVLAVSARDFCDVRLDVKEGELYMSTCGSVVDSRYPERSGFVRWRCFLIRPLPPPFTPPPPPPPFPTTFFFLLIH